MGESRPGELGAWAIASLSATEITAEVTAALGSDPGRIRVRTDGWGWVEIQDPYAGWRVLVRPGPLPLRVQAEGFPPQARARNGERVRRLAALLDRLRIPRERPPEGAASTALSVRRERSW